MKLRWTRYGWIEEVDERGHRLFDIARLNADEDLATDPPIDVLYQRAQEIVHRYNTHDELLDAAKYALRCLDAAEDQFMVQDELRLAIAKARGEM